MGVSCSGRAWRVFWRWSETLNSLPNAQTRWKRSKAYGTPTRTWFCSISVSGRTLSTAIAEEIDAAPCARALSHGVSGVFLGSDSPARLMQAIRLVASGEAWVDRRVIQLLADRYPQHEDLRLDSLEERERAVLRGVLGGSTNRQIAGQIGTSEATVKATLQHLFDKTGVRTRSQLVRIMLDGSHH
ncbi:MAG: response regulator transcription factor [Bryobacteraceae bacterium]